MKRTLRSSKSHGGCSSCKNRRVKCDETRPTCLICRANGLDCPGYQKKLKWSSKHEKFRPPFTSRRSSDDHHLPSIPRLSHEAHNSSGPMLCAQPGSPSPVTGTTPSLALTTAMEDSVGSLPMAEWPSFDVAGFEHFGLSDFPFEDHRTSFLPSQSARHDGDFMQSGMQQDLPSSPCQNTPPASTHSQPTVSRDEKREGERPTTDGSKRFLQTYYRISQPGRVSGLTDEDFVNYYFHNVCTVYSCFDSPCNQFRTLVSEAWTSSPTIYLAIQSMAAGHLANHYPSLAPLGLQRRSQAWRYLQKDLQLHRVGKIPTETVLLSLLLLGPSSSWHQASNLGMQFLFIARNLMQAFLRESCSGAGARELHDAEFFHQAFLRWEMAASFVDPVPFTALAGNMRLPEPRRPGGNGSVFPHPWTGIAPEVHFAVAEVGRMLRRRRNHSDPTPGSSRTAGRAYMTAADDQWVESLESFLHEVELPTTSEIANYEDVRTSSADLIMTADAMRFVGLLEIYGVYPSLLRRRAHDDVELSGYSFASTGNDSGLAAMAMHMLESVKPIAITSAACRFLPFVLLVAGTRLSLGTNASDEEQEDVLQTRYIVEARMLLLSRKYPQKPILQMLDIIKEMWQRLDQGSSESHWLDIADEKGWQTMVG